MVWRLDKNTNSDENKETQRDSAIIIVPKRHQKGKTIATGMLVTTNPRHTSAQIRKFYQEALF